MQVSDGKGEYSLLCKVLSSWAKNMNCVLRCRSPELLHPWMLPITSSNDSVFDMLITVMSNIQEEDRKTAFETVEDAYHLEWLCSILPTAVHGRAVFAFASISVCSQLVCGSTHQAGNCLLVVVSDVLHTVKVATKHPLGVSDQSPISIQFDLDRISQRTPSPKAYSWAVVWIGTVKEDVSSVRIEPVFRSKGRRSALNDEVTEIIPTRASVRKVSVFSSDKTWVKQACHRVRFEASSLPSLVRCREMRIMGWVRACQSFLRGSLQKCKRTERETVHYVRLVQEAVHFAVGYLWYIIFSPCSSFRKWAAEYWPEGWSEFFDEALWLQAFVCLISCWLWSFSTTGFDQNSLPVEIVMELLLLRYSNGGNDFLIMFPLFL